MGRSESGKRRDKKRTAATLVVDAKLLDAGAPAPKPGTVYILSLMHYAVLRVVRGRYPHASIFVAHHLPDLDATEFRVGAHHRLYLTKEFPEHASILDAFQTDVSRTTSFFCLAFELLAPGPV